MSRNSRVVFRQLSYEVVGAAMEVHRVLGPGFLESVYENALARELTLKDIPFLRQQRIPAVYKGKNVGDYVADIIVDDKIILELKATTRLNNKHKAQAINYLAATNFRLALILNFGESSLRVKRVVRKDHNS